MLSSKLYKHTENTDKEFNNVYNKLQEAFKSLGQATSAGSGSLPIYASNSAAKAAGLSVGAFYRTGGDPDYVCIVH